MKIGDATLYTGDALTVLKTLPDESVQTCITSPPYFGLRDYGVDGQIGLEPTIDEYVAKLVEIFREVRRVLRDDGTLWLNLGDSYAGSWGAQGRQGKNGVMVSRSVVSARQIENHPKRASQTGKIRDAGLKPKDLSGIPWRVAFALQTDGWYLRQDIIWHKPNPMPESVRDRCTKAHEHLFLLAKSGRYYFDQEAISEPVTGNAHRRKPWKGHGSFHREGREKGRPLGVNPKATEPGQGIRQNTSFSEAVSDLVDERNRRSVWTIATAPFPGAHFATFPPDLIRPCILAGAPPGGVVLDPFSGSGTTGMVALQEGRKYIGIELNPEYQKLAVERITPAAKQPRLLA